MRGGRRGRHGRPWIPDGLLPIAGFARLYGLDWIAIARPTVKLTAQAFGPARANLMFCWIFASHQHGAGFATLMAGVLRNKFSSWKLAFQAAGMPCLFDASFCVRAQTAAGHCGSGVGGDALCHQPMGVEHESFGHALGAFVGVNDGKRIRSHQHLVDLKKQVA